MVFANLPNKKTFLKGLERKKALFYSLYQLSVALFGFQNAF